MTWFLFVLYLHTDEPTEIYRWQFESQAGCVHAAEFITKEGKDIKAACIQDEAEPVAYQPKVTCDQLDAFDSGVKCNAPD